MPELGFDDELVLSGGVRLRSSGVSAAVREPGARGFGANDDANAVLAPVIAAAGMRTVLTVPLDDVAVRGVAPAVDLTAPAPGPGEGQVVLEVDEAGLVRWHPAVDAASARAAVPSADQTFRIPVTDHRNLLGLGIRKLLRLIRFPIEAAAAATGTTVVGWWEDRNRPHSLNVLTPGTLATVPAPGGTAATHLADSSDEPFLVLVHGTFSTIRSGFSGLGRADVAGPGLAELVDRYDGRVLGFDHPTLHVDPATNADWFLRRLPVDRPVTLDLLTHSRGGLVGRRIADPRSAAAAGVPVPNIRRLIHVATPNGGTVLASPKRWTTLIDLFSNLISLVPDEPATATAEAVIELVKQVATGVFDGLDGLTAMDPANPAVAAANTAAAPVGGAAGLAGTVRAIASDFTPSAGGVKLRALNAIVDRFFGAGNDLVVPTEGVYTAGDYRITDPFVVPSPSAVVHTGFFADAQVRAKLGEWLPGR